MQQNTTRNGVITLNAGIWWYVEYERVVAGYDGVSDHTLCSSIVWKKASQLLCEARKTNKNKMVGSPFDGQA